MGAPPCQVKMLRAGCLRRIKTFFNQHTHSGPRSLKTTSNHKEDVLLQMENPYKQPQKGCTLCNIHVDYRNIQLLSQFISPYTGRIYGRHITGLCGIKQKEVSKAIKKAHSMGFMSVTHKHPQFMKDPNICGVKHVDK